MTISPKAQVFGNAVPGIVALIALLLPSAALAQWWDYPILLPADPASREVHQDGQAVDVPVARVGTGTAQGSGGKAIVFLVKLPSIKGTIVDASLWFSVKGHAGHPNPVDLYALGTRDSADVPKDAYYEGDARSDENATLIQRELLNPKTSPAGRLTTSWEGGQTLAAYLQKIYASGGKAGQYVLLRLSPAESKPGPEHGFDLYSADDPAMAPTLRISVDRRDSPPPIALNPELPVQPRQARRADDLVESMGVAVHIAYIASRAEYERNILPALLDMGIRYYRDGGTAPEFIRRVNELGSQGLKGLMVVVPEGDKTAKEIVESSVAPMAGSIWGIEGPNEPDVEWRRFPSRNYKGQHYPEAIVTFQRELYDAIKHSDNGQVRKLVVLTPPLAHPDGNIARLGALPGDMADLHPYQGGQLPDDQLQIKWLPPMHKSVLNNPDAPIVVSESGWHNQLVVDGQPGISEIAEARYAMRLYFDFWNAGIVRTHLYNLSTDQWGILRPDGSRKPAFYAIKNLIAICQDRAPSQPLNSVFEPGRLSFGLSGETGNVRYQLLQKRDGRFLLALWQNAFSYDTRGQNLIVPEQQIVVRFDQAVSKCRLFVPLLTDRAVAELEAAKDGNYPVAVPDHPIFIEVTPR